MRCHSGTFTRWQNQRPDRAIEARSTLTPHLAKASSQFDLLKLNQRDTRQAILPNHISAARKTTPVSWPLGKYVGSDLDLPDSLTCNILKG